MAGAAIHVWGNGASAAIADAYGLDRACALRKLLLGMNVTVLGLALFITSLPWDNAFAASQSSGVAPIVPSKLTTKHQRGEKSAPQSQHGGGKATDRLPATPPPPKNKDRLPAAKPLLMVVPELPTRAPPELRAKRGKVPTPAPPKSPSEMLSSAWSPAEVEAATAQCAHLQLDARMEYKPLPPVRDGECGAPAPMSLKSFTDTPRVEMRPAVTINCKLADALDRWLRTVVQPRAWALLDAKVIRVASLAGYDCRFRNGGAATRVSQHAYANAIDIAGFVTAKGEHIRLTEHWGAGDERAQFLRDIHKGACKIFGTVLGPDANTAHNNHFHLDMTPRRHSSVCE
jgi:hypothetical protein